MLALESEKGGFVSLIYGISGIRWYKGITVYIPFVVPIESGNQTWQLNTPKYG